LLASQDPTALNSGSPSMVVSEGPTLLNSDAPSLLASQDPTALNSGPFDLFELIFEALSTIGNGETLSLNSSEQYNSFVFLRDNPSFDWRLYSESKNIQRFAFAVFGMFTSGDPSIFFDVNGDECMENDDYRVVCGVVDDLVTEFEVLNFDGFAVVEELGLLSTLDKLKISNSSLLLNMFGGAAYIPYSIRFLESLTELDMSSNANLQGGIPPELGNSISLTRINFSNCPSLGIGQIPSDLSALEDLRILNLENTGTSGMHPQLNMENLIRLDLSNNIMSSIPPNIESFYSLKYLYLNNNLAEALPSFLFNLSNLIELTLHRNLMIGSLPSTIGILQNIERLNIGKNMLGGTLPQEIGSMNMIRRLNLHGNFFSGTIPNSISTLTLLRILRLEENMLSGAIPERITTMTSLQTLRLEYNSIFQDVCNGGVLLNSLSGICNPSSTVTPVCIVSSLTTFIMDCSESICECCTDCIGASSSPPPTDAPSSANLMLDIEDEEEDFFGIF